MMEIFVEKMIHAKQKVGVNVKAAKERKGNNARKETLNEQLNCVCGEDEINFKASGDNDWICLDACEVVQKQSELESDNKYK